jgi:prepilin peptidase CpaA
MGGGDVKLIAAIALWLHWLSLIQLLVVMSIAGGVLTLSMLVHQKIKKNSGQLEVPYGVAISFAGLWVIYERYFNHFA